MSVSNFEVHAIVLQATGYPSVALPDLVLESYISAIVDTANGRALESLGNNCFDVSLHVPIESLLPIVRSRFRSLPEREAHAPSKRMLLVEAIALSLSEVFPCKKLR